MPTPDASQYTQFRRYTAIAGDALGSVGSKISPFNTSYSIPILSASSQALFLPSANKEKKFPPPPSNVPGPSDPLWIAQIGSGTNYTYVNGTVVCSDGTILVAGETLLKVLPAGSETYDYVVGFIARYTSSGSFIGAVSFGSGNTNVGIDSVIVDGQGGIYVTGYTQENLAAYRQYAGQNGFVAKFTPEFELGWLQELGSGFNHTYSWTSLLAPNGYLYAAVLTDDSDWNNITSPHSYYNGRVGIILLLDPVTGVIYNGFIIGDEVGSVYMDQIVWIPQGSFAPVGTIPNLIAVVGNASCSSLNNGQTKGIPGVDNAGDGGRYGYIYLLSEFLEPGSYWGIGSGNSGHFTGFFSATLLPFPYGALIVAAGKTREYLYSDGEHEAGDYLAGGGTVGFTAGLFGNIESATIYPIRYVGHDSNDTYIGSVTSDINQQLYISGSSTENNSPTDGGAVFQNGTRLGFALKTYFCTDNTAYIQIGKASEPGSIAVWQQNMASDILGNTYVSGGTYQNLTDGTSLTGYSEDGFLVKAYNPEKTYNTPIFMTSHTSQCDPAGELYFRITFTGTLTVDWGDGNVETIAVSEDRQGVNHIYGIGVYKIAIDVSQGGSITYFRVTGMGLYSLDVTKCPTLTYLRCNSNLLTVLDVSQCLNLTYLRCNSNALSNVDVSGLAGLNYLDIGSNPLYTVHFERCGLSSITDTTLLDAINQINNETFVKIYVDPVQNGSVEGGFQGYFSGNLQYWVFIVTPGVPALGDLSYQFPTFGRGVAYGNGIFVAVGDSVGATGGPYTNVLVSIDEGQSFKIPSGITGNVFPGGGQSLARSVAYGNNVWVVTGDDSTNGRSGQTMKYSIDNAATWTTCSGAMPGTRATSVAFNNDQYSPVWVATGNANNEDYTLFTSSDGINWSGADTQFGTDGEGRAVAYGNGTWVATGRLTNYEIVVLYSTDDGSSWSSADIPSELSNNGSSRHGLAFGLGQDGDYQFVLTVGYTTAFVSPDGTEWTLAIDGSTDTSHLWQPPPFANDPSEWTFGAGIAFADNTWMFSSGTNHRQPFFAYNPTDGSTGPYCGWRVEQTGDYIPGYGNGVAQGSGNWVVVGSNNGSGNTIIASKNGLAWTGSEISPPSINNLVIASGGGAGQSTAVLTWDETNVTSREISFTPSSPSVSNFIAGTVTLSHSSSDETYAVTITVTNAAGSASATINVTVGCFLGFVKVKTLDGPVAVEDIVVGTKILQPTGKYSKVVELKRTTITDRVSDGDGRLYADAEEKMVVTYWHKIRFSDETEETKAGEHPRLHQVFRPTPFDVFHIKLEDPVNDKVLIYDTDITAEGFVPVNPL